MNNSNELLKICKETVKLIENGIVPNYIKILCIDDNPNDPIWLSAVLARSKKINYKTEMAHTYTDGLFLVKERKHDVYIIDLKLNGGGDGIDLIQDCIKSGYDGPFIVWSGYLDERIYDREVSSNVNFISKNENNVYVLDNLIRNTIRRWKINKELLKLKDYIS